MYALVATGLRTSICVAGDEMMVRTLVATLVATSVRGLKFALHTLVAECVR